MLSRFVALSVSLTLEVSPLQFTTGDDNIAGHANDTLVEDSYFGSGHGASIGSLCDSYIRNFTVRNSVSLSSSVSSGPHRKERRQVRNCSFHGTTAATRIKSHPGCGGHVWDVRYEDLTLHDCPTAIQLNQFYFAKPGDKPATMRFERIHFVNITAHRGGGGSAGSGGDTEAVVNLDCDTKYNGVNNCDVTLQDVHFTGLSKKEQETGMVCKGVKGTATVRPQRSSLPRIARLTRLACGGLQGLTGLNNCLKEAR